MIFSFYKEKSKLIYDKDKLKEFIFASFSENISIKDIEKNSDKLSLLKDFIIKKSTNDLKLLSIGNIDINKVTKLKNYLIKENIKNLDLISSITEISKFKAEDSIFIVIELGLIGAEEIKTLNKYFDLNSLKPEGIIIFEE